MFLLRSTIMSVCSLSISTTLKLGSRLLMLRVVSSITASSRKKSKSRRSITCKTFKKNCSSSSKKFNLNSKTSTTSPTSQMTMSQMTIPMMTLMLPMKMVRQKKIRLTTATTRTLTKKTLSQMMAFRVPAASKKISTSQLMTTPSL